MKRFIITLFLIASSLLTGCSARQQTSSVVEKTVDNTKKDTTKPVIEFKASSVTVVIGNDYKITDNIKSVTDDTDGALKEVDKDKIKDGEAYYTIDDSAVDFNKAGEYEVKVTAKDSSGNAATNSFKLTMKEDDTKKETEKKNTTEKKESSSTDSKTSSKKSTTKSSNSTATAKKATASTNLNTQASSSNNTQSNTASNQAQAVEQQTQSNAHVHDWVYVEAEYKTVTNTTTTPEVAVDEPVTVEKVKCITCGALFDNTDEFYYHSDTTWHGNYTTEDIPTGETRHVVIQEAKTETTETKELVSPAHYECRTCGDWKQA